MSKIVELADTVSELTFHNLFKKTTDSIRLLLNIEIIISD
jgi:hypothetical protein